MKDRSGVLIAEFLETARDAVGWEVLPPIGAEPVALPDDLALFRELCGGVRSPSGLEVGCRLDRAQDVILGERYPDDPSFAWHVIAETGQGSTDERAVIDLGADHPGRCYDGFWDRFGVAGSMPMIATSFTDLLVRVQAAGGEVYWREDLGLGDAYDA